MRITNVVDRMVIPNAVAVAIGLGKPQKMPSGGEIPPVTPGGGEGLSAAVEYRHDGGGGTRGSEQICCHRDLGVKLEQVAKRLVSKDRTDIAARARMRSSRAPGPRRHAV